MPATDVADLRAMPEDGLLNELEEGQRALFNLRFQAATRQLADVSQVRRARRRVARIKTLLHERTILAAYGALAEAAAPTEEPADAATGEPADESGDADEPRADGDDADDVDADDDAADDDDADGEDADDDDEGKE